MSDDVEAVQACLRDDAATLRDDNKECEIASNMDAAATLIGRLTEELAAANEARQKAERERDVARETARVRSGEALDYYSAMLNLAHEFGAKDGDNMIEVIGNGIDALRAEVERLQEDAERYRWLRRPTTLGIGMVNIWSKGQGRYDAWQGDELDAAIDAARKR